MKKLIVLVLILMNTGILFSQVLSRVVPDTGRQGKTFPIRIYGTGTEWTLSPYFEVYFDSIGINTNNVVILNDTTLS